MWCFVVFFFFFPCISPVGRSGGSCVIPVSHGLTWGGGRGKWGTIAIFTDALGTHQHCDITTAGCQPLHTFKRRETRFLFLGDAHIHVFYPTPDSLSSFSSTFWKGSAPYIGFLSNIYHQAPTSLSASPVSMFFRSSFSKAGSLKLKLNQTHTRIVA